VRTGQAIPGEPEAACQLLREGHKLFVSPGGVREAIAGREWYYRVHWGQRLGFARLALRAQVPLVPVFGENVEELYRAPGVHARPIQALYERTRLPLVPIVGLGPLPFPVKIRTWIGPPVVPVAGETPEHLRDRTRDALQALMDAHQPRRPRLLRGLVERLRG
jgi:1-acyl-sn-glycerol-3-phosphate acyltransferase